MKHEPFTVIVPARLASVRLPDKPLADIGGMPMLVRVLRQAAASRAAAVIAAVDEQKLADAVTRAGFQAVLTGACDSGSRRVAEAAAALGLPPQAIVVNVQGDEPFIEPELINAVAARAAAVPCVCATPCRPLQNEEEYHNPAAVKVVGDADNNAVYFSRAAIPHRRGGGAPAAARIHLGLYAYRLGELQRLIALPPAPAEEAEQLEQLRILWHGGRIALADCRSDSFGVDTAEDLARARARAAAAS